jgi:hypothetical protein
MCGKCETCMGKAGTGLGMVSLLVAVVLKLAHVSIMGVGPRSFAGASALFLLLAIAANTAPHEHPPG